MTIQEHIDYHEDKINRLYDERDRLQNNLHSASGENNKITVEDLFYYTKAIANIDRDLRASIDTRITLLNIRGENKN